MGKTRGKSHSLRIEPETSADLLLRHLGLDPRPPIIPQRVVEAEGLKKLSPEAWALVEPHWSRARAMVVESSPQGYLALNALRKRLDSHRQAQWTELEEARFDSAVASLVADEIRAHMMLSTSLEHMPWEAFEGDHAAADGAREERELAQAREEKASSMPLIDLEGWPPPEGSKRSGGFEVFIVWTRSDDRFMAEASSWSGERTLRTWSPYHSRLTLREAAELARERVDETNESEREQELKLEIVDFRLSVVSDILREYEFTGDVVPWETRLARWFVPLAEHEKPIVKLAKEDIAALSGSLSTRTDVIKHLNTAFVEFGETQLKNFFKRIGAYRARRGRGKTGGNTPDVEFLHFKDVVDTYYAYYELGEEPEIDARSAGSPIRPARR